MSAFAQWVLLDTAHLWYAEDEVQAALALAMGEWELHMEGELDA